MNENMKAILSHIYPACAGMQIPANDKVVCFGAGFVSEPGHKICKGCRDVWLSCSRVYHTDISDKDDQYFADRVGFKTLLHEIPPFIELTRSPNSSIQVQ